MIVMIVNTTKTSSSSSTLLHTKLWLAKLGSEEHESKQMSVIACTIDTWKSHFFFFSRSFFWLFKKPNFFLFVYGRPHWTWNATLTFEILLVPNIGALVPITSVKDWIDRICHHGICDRIHFDGDSWRSRARSSGVGIALHATTKQPTRIER